MDSSVLWRAVIAACEGIDESAGGLATRQMSSCPPSSMCRMVWGWGCMCVGMGVGKSLRRYERCELLL
jgi:hypothetical protein